MAGITGMGDTFDLPNYVGELFFITPRETPFLAMIGGLTGGRTTGTKQITWQTVDNASASQPAISEATAATAPTAAQRSRSEVVNHCQIHHEALDISYRKLGAVNNIDGESILGTQPVRNELTFQQKLKMQKAARDVEYSFLQGAYAAATDVNTAGKTRGLKNAITTNTVAAGSAVVTRPMIQEVLREMADSGAPFLNSVIFANAFNKQVITDLYAYAPDSRNVGGVNIRTIEHDFGVSGVVYDRHMPTDEIYIVEMSVCAPHFLPVPGKPHVFWEPLSKTGASEKWQLYFDIGLEYGPELWHGSVTGTATSA